MRGGGGSSGSGVGAAAKAAVPVLCLGLGVLLGWVTSAWARWARQQLLQLLWPLGPLRLQRPLVTFDIEATGLNVSRDRILEIAAVKLLPSGKVLVKGPQRLNPGVTISAEVTAIHSITAEDVAGCPRFADVAAEWRDFLQGCDLLGYNAKKFDVPILRNEFRRAGVFNFPELGVPVVDAFRIFCNQEPRTLSAAVQYYTGRPLGRDAAHSALGDARATLRVLVEQVRRYPELPRSVPALAALCAAPSRAQDVTPDGKFQWRGDQPILGFGKYQGEPLAVLVARHQDHLMWMSGQDWGDESLIVVAQALKGLLPAKGGGWRSLFDTPPPGQDGGGGGAADGERHSGGSKERRGSHSNGSVQQDPPCEPQSQQQGVQLRQPQPPLSWGPFPAVPAAAAAAAGAAAAGAAAAGTAAAGTAAGSWSGDTSTANAAHSTCTGNGWGAGGDSSTTANADCWGADAPAPTQDSWGAADAADAGSAGGVLAADGGGADCGGVDSGRDGADGGCDAAADAPAAAAAGTQDGAGDAHAACTGVDTAPAFAAGGAVGSGGLHSQSLGVADNPAPQQPVGEPEDADKAV